MKNVQKIDLGLTGYDELFANDEERKVNKLPRIFDIPISEIDDFPDHPFKVKIDEDMDQLVQSIKERGIITPVTLRPKEDGRYEIVSGHRRKKACEIAGLDTVKAEVREMSRDEAIILMVESNLQRSTILPSEKAFSYKMRLEAMKRQAGRPAQDNYSPVGNNTVRELRPAAGYLENETVYRVAPGVMFMTRSDPQLTLGKRSLKLNGVCRDKLGKGRYVEFLYHPILEVIAVRSAYATNPNAVLWDETKSSVLQLCSSAFSGAIFDKLDWMKKYKFRFRGVTRIRDGERIIFFFLDEPQILVGKAAKQIDTSDATEGTAKFIPYKESEDRKDAFQTAGIAYPENWQERLGVSYEIKQKRESVLDAISATDISNPGKKVINPYIGVIPSVSELEEELEQLYDAM